MVDVPQASNSRTGRPDQLSDADLDQAIEMVQSGEALSAPTHDNALFAERASRTWQGWLLAHQGLPRLRLECTKCGYKWGYWRLNYGHDVSMPDVDLEDPKPGVVAHTELIARGKGGALRDSYTHDGRGTITYTCPRRNCSSNVPLRATTRTLLYLQALRADQNVIVL
jgi:hypothetical protein